MLKLNNKTQLLDLLTQGAVVLSPNNRLSAALLQSYFTHCNKSTVIKPQCLPYTIALLNTFEEIKFKHHGEVQPTLLNQAQCRYLWQLIIQKTKGITYSTGLLQAVMQAWKYCEQWQISPHNPSFSYTPQTQTFQDWWHAFNKELEKLNALHEFQLADYLIKRKQSLFNAPLIWVCFDEFTPQQLSLQTHLQEQGLNQYHYDLTEQTPSPQLYAAENNKEEYQQLIQWLQLKLKQSEKRIAVVVPELEQESRHLKRCLSQHFDASLFNISLGEPLGQYPLVEHALSWLHLAQNCTQQEMSLLIQSPYIGGAQAEFIARSQCLQDSPLLQQRQGSLKQLSTSLQAKAPILAEHLNRISSYPKSASPNEWVGLFQKRLNSLGFPGDYGLNSAQYQCYQRFLALFDEFRQLTMVSAQFSESEALDALNQLAATTIFQAQKSNARIQISGLLEASGCEFDSLWVMGLTDQCLPGKTKLSAFIPPQLQRDLYMPHSSPERELHFAQQTLQRLHRGSQETVFSYPKLQGDRPGLPSALIAHYPLFISATELRGKENITALITLQEDYSVPLKAEEKLTGGTALLGNQAKCPFKAFAEHRLAAKPLPNITEGIDNKERGTMIHKIMELLWRDLATQHNLLYIEQDKLDHLIINAIELANKELQKESMDELPAVIQEIEYTRLKRLVLGCLEWEKQRPSFEIASLEQSYSINLAGLEIKVRVDRLDKVADKTWVIDYKSTLPANKPWNEDRPQEPQLLLYALLNEDINTLLFMQIKTGNIMCSGLSENPSEIKGISTLKKEECWVDTREYWQQQLTSLVEEVLSGYCPPLPINATVCSYCDFKNLCRI
jgi:probable DNA repair protein